MTASFGDSSVRSQIADDDPAGFRGFSIRAPEVKSAFLADIFASASFTAQHGNFQRLFLDLTRFHARLDFPSGSKFLSGATHLAQDFFNSQQPNLEAIQDICPNATLSLQQQVSIFLLYELYFPSWKKYFPEFKCDFGMRETLRL